MADWQKAFNVHRLFRILLLLPILTKGLQDNRCFLENGASSETFFVVEDVPVGDTIGRVRVVGDPRPAVGSIALRLKESDSPIGIAPGSKNLTLKRPLDKEGIDGPSSVFVTLVCDRLETLDLSFEIPINIRVTDANDNAPVFINAPYVLNISEVTVMGTRVLQGVHAIDNDQQGPFSSVRYSVLPGPNSEYFEFENELEGTLVLNKPLDYETLKTFDVNIRAQDHGDPPKSADTVLTVHVIDADDQNPRFLDDRYESVILDPAMKNTVLKIHPRDIRAFDQDEGIGAPIYYTWNGVGSEYAMFQLNRDTGKVTLAKNFAENDLQSPAILVIRATQLDNPDRYALATLTVTRSSTKGIRFIHPVFNFRASEGLSPGAPIGSLSNNHPGHHLKYFVSDQSVLSVFAINTLGEVSLKNKLDYETKPEYIFKVFATDGKTNDSSVVNVTVENVNEWEPRFRYPHYDFFAGMNGGVHDLVGKIEAADGDRGDRLTLSLSGPDASMFFITPNGDLRLRDIKDLQGSTATLTVTATDSGDPPKKTSVPVTVHFPGFTGVAAAGTAASKSSGSGPILLAGLGVVLLLLSLVVAVLVAYIYKVKRKSNAEQSGDVKDKALLKSHISNPMFSTDKMRPGTAVALGGIPSEASKSRVPSPKVHPAPQPPATDLWTSTAGRVKKLSWGDKTEPGSVEDLEELDTIPKVLESNNLTVYF
ncbi:protocadherin-23 [Dendroctonus ponderosae]|uniref:protocadherin-23 n=1 Tax=Dendroctonus ponderosae TaxID=77166 RepID=UPI002034DFA3|nr:protocadherin-23 [Dendroctonus ponderosae]